MFNEPQNYSDNCNTSACVMTVFYQIEKWTRILRWAIYRIY